MCLEIILVRTGAIFLKHFLLYEELRIISVLVRRNCLVFGSCNVTKKKTIISHMEKYRAVSQPAILGHTTAAFRLSFDCFSTVRVQTICSCFQPLRNHQ